MQKRTHDLLPYSTPARFQPLADGEHADAYFGLRESLEALFGRPIDLVMTGAIRNRYFVEAIGPTRTLMYAA